MEILEKPNVITVIPYLTDIKCPVIINELFSHQQDSIIQNVPREVNINHNRHICQQMLKDRTDIKTVLLMDSDVLATEEQINLLYDAYDGDPIVLNTKNVINFLHVCCACCLISFEDYMKIDYLEKPEECQCLKVMRICPKIHYLPKVVSSEFRIRHRKPPGYYSIKNKVYI